MPARGSKGFSLIEIVVVVAIVAGLAAIALPRYGAALNNYRASGAGKAIASLILEAQARARASSGSVRIVVSGNTVSEVDSGGNTVRSLALSGGALQARMHRSVLGGDDRVIFDGYGAPDSIATFQIASGSSLCTVTIDAQGRVAVSDVAALSSATTDTSVVADAGASGSDTSGGTSGGTGGTSDGTSGGINVQIGPIGISLGGGGASLQLN